MNTRRLLLLLLAGLVVPAAVLLFVLSRPAGRPAAADGDWVSSLAVLPFDRREAGGAAPYLSEGIARDLTDGLAEIRELRVAPFAASRAFRQPSQSPARIAEALGATYLLRGSIGQAADGQVTVRVALVDARDDRPLWGQTYRQPFDQLLAIESDIMIQVAGALKVELLPAVAVRIKRKPTENIEAYRQYLMARHAPAPRQALTRYREAVRLDPGFAPGYAGLAQTYLALGAGGFAPRDSAYSLARQYAAEAMNINPQSVEALTVLGVYACEYERDCDKAVTLLRKAVELRPGDAALRRRLAEALRAAGDAEGARKELEVARRMDSGG